MQPDEDGTAAHDDLHQQIIKINTIYIYANYRMPSLEIITSKLRQCVPCLCRPGGRDLASPQRPTCSGPSMSPMWE